MPLAVALRSVPIVTTAPLGGSDPRSGRSRDGRAGGVMVFFPTFVACLHGLRQAPGRILDVFDSYAARPAARGSSMCAAGDAACLLRRGADGGAGIGSGSDGGRMARDRAGDRQPHGPLGVAVGLRHALVRGRGGGAAVLGGDMGRGAGRAPRAVAAMPPNSSDMSAPRSRLCHSRRHRNAHGRLHLRAEAARRPAGARPRRCASAAGRLVPRPDPGGHGGCRRAARTGSSLTGR